MTTATVLPRRASARGSAPATSASPPVLANPTTSDAATSTRTPATAHLPVGDWQGHYRGAGGERQSSLKKAHKAQKAEITTRVILVPFVPLCGYFSSMRRVTARLRTIRS